MIRDKRHIDGFVDFFQFCLVTASVTRFGDFWDFWQQLFCPNFPHSLAIFVKVSKSLICLAKSFLSNFCRHLAIFYWSLWSRPTFFNVINDSKMFDQRYLILRLKLYLMTRRCLSFSFDFTTATSSSIMTSLDDDVITDASLDDGGGESDDKVWGMPKYEHNHLGNLTDEEYLAAVSQFVYHTCM